MPSKSTTERPPRPRRSNTEVEAARSYLIQTRTNLGLTQEQVSRRISMGQSNYSKIELGRWDVMMDTAQAITDVLWEEMKIKGIQRSYRDLFADLWLGETRRHTRKDMESEA